MVVDPCEKREKNSGCDWSNLHEDMLELVAQRLTHVPDYISFAAVCVSWRLVAVHLPRLRQIPFLMIPNNQVTRGIYSLTEDKVYNNFQLSVPPKSCCCGSGYGWLIIVDESRGIRLLNPLSKENNEIQLPPLTALPFIEEDNYYWDRCITKAILSSNPSSSLDFVVLTLFYSPHLDLAFCRPGDKTWTSIQLQHAPAAIDDMLFYNNKFNVVCQNGAVLGAVLAFDVGDPRQSFETVASPHPVINWNKKYVVESLGDLLLVERIIVYYVFWRNKSGDLLKVEEREITDEEEEAAAAVNGPEPRPMRSYGTSSFNVYKLDSTKGEWVKLKSLGDRMLFLGDNTSLSLSASGVPGCKPNCIYFTDDSMDKYGALGGSRDFGIFNLEDGSIGPLHYPIYSQPIMPPPIWVLPTL